MTRTIQLKGITAKNFLRRGYIPAGIYRQIQQGAQVSIEYGGNLTSSYRPVSITVDGRTTYYKGQAPEPERSGPSSPTPGEQYLGSSGGAKTTFQRTVRDTSPPRIVSRPTTISEAEKQEVVLEEPKYPYERSQSQAPAGFQRGFLYPELNIPSSPTPTAEEAKTLGFYERGRAGAELIKEIPSEGIPKGFTQATLGYGLKAVKGGLEISYLPTELGQKVQERFYPKMTARAKEFDKLIGFNREKLRSDLAPKAEDIAAFGTVAGFATGGAVLPKIVQSGVSVGVGALGISSGVKAAKAGDVEKAAEGFTIGVLGGMEAPGLIRSLGVKVTARTGKLLGLAEYVPPEKVFEPKVLRGKTTFPSTPSAKIALKEFRKTPEVAHVTAREFSETIIGAGKRQREASEGLFVTPKGKASAYFARVMGRDEGGVGLIGVPPVLKPATIEIGVAGAKRIPKNVLLGGKETTIKFLRGKAGTGEVFITPGSEARSSKVISKALGIRGTGELEALLPVGTQIRPRQRNVFERVTGFKRYTELEGEVIPIREFDVVLGERGKRVKAVESLGRETGYRDIARVGKREIPITRLFAPIRRSTISSRRTPIREVTRLISRPSRSTERINRVIERPGERISRPTERNTTRILRELTRTTRQPSRPRVSERSMPSITRLISRPGTRMTSLIDRPVQPVKMDFKFFLPEESKKQERELKRVFKYKPTIEAVEYKIKGKKPKTLTGLEVRPIL